MLQEILKASINTIKKKRKGKGKEKERKGIEKGKKMERKGKEKGSKQVLDMVIISIKKIM